MTIHRFPTAGEEFRQPLMKPSLTVDWARSSQGYLICRPRGDIDAYTVARFRQAIAEASSQGALVFDLAAVPFVDSAGLGALIGGIRRIRDLGGDVAIAAGRPVLARLLHSTGFDRIVSITGDVESAAAQLELRMAELSASSS